MSFKCLKCGTVLEGLTDNMVRCPSCGHRIVMKSRDPIAKEIKAV